ncbi:O-antigen ligase family protein [Ornithinimicrobium cerasi]|uniref:O-antigen ligase family protein n=1 Tax=Ornithinimicrobium cerasi TaxID=2248773 RepID=UPI000EFE7B7D|nr:O-antigen ligase family protein [Ornithinimicrobium cerasi]
MKAKSDVRSQSKAAGAAADLQSVTLAILAAVAVTNPNFGLRTGAAVGAVLLVTRLGSLRLSRSEGYVSLYALMTLCSLTWAVFDGWVGLINVVACAVLYLAVRAVVRRRRDVLMVTAGLVAGAVFGVARMVVGQGADVRWTYEAEVARVALGDVNFNFTAYGFATAAAMMTVFFYGATWKRAAFVLMAMVSATLYVGVLLNGTRGALLSLGALAVWLFLGRFHQVLFPWVIGLFLVASLVLATGWADGAIRNVASSGALGREAGDLNGRLTIWPLAREFITERPVLGYGVDVFKGLSPARFDAHNWVLDVAVAFGAAGLALFTRALYLAVVVEPRAWAHPRRVSVVGAWVVVTGPILLSGFWFQSPVLWLSLAVISCLPAMQVRLDGSEAPGKAQAGIPAGVATKDVAVPRRHEPPWV